MASDRKTIIIVDDDDDLMRLLVAAFRAKGVEVHPIKNGAEAVSYLMNEDNVKAASLLILDRVLPDMDGLDILHKFREKSKVKLHPFSSINK